MIHKQLEGCDNISDINLEESQLEDLKTSAKTRKPKRLLLVLQIISERGKMSTQQITIQRITKEKIEFSEDQQKESTKRTTELILKGLIRAGYIEVEKGIGEIECKINKNFAILKIKKGVPIKKKTKKSTEIYMYTITQEGRCFLNPKTAPK
ncbi:hypothetical protein KAJ41_02715 [Candidatus Parcubacteria bacterium]|nr:hypothetical protein [Candidatus Parcubacteria bacterium]